jgi:hypothetical protein
MLEANLHQLRHTDRSTRRSKRRPRGRERRRQMAVLAVIGAILAAGLLAKKEIEITRSSAEPAIAPSDDEIYTGSILFVPDDGRICRQILFDNRTGLLNDNGLVDCERAYYQGQSKYPKQWSRARIISEGFLRH